MEIGVKVEAEPLIGGVRRHTTSAYLVMVALGDDGHPVEVPELLVLSDEDRRRQRQAQVRRQVRAERLERLRAHDD